MFSPVKHDLLMKKTNNVFVFNIGHIVFMKYLYNFASTKFQYLNFLSCMEKVLPMCLFICRTSKPGGSFL
jgi:hypothetical protein